MDTSDRFDAFLSYNSKNGSQAIQIAEGLRDRELTIWFDQWKLPPGTPFVLEIDKMIKAANATIILIGDSDFGPWQVAEMQQALKQFVEKKATVIPVLLPGAPGQPDLPGFLSIISWMDFRDGITELGLDRLAAILSAGTRRGVTSLLARSSSKALHELLDEAKHRVVISGHTLDRFSRSNEVMAALNHALARDATVTFVQLNPKSKHAEAHRPYHELESRSPASRQHEEALNFFRLMFSGLQSNRRSNLEVVFTNYMPKFRTVIVDDNVHVYFYMYGTDVSDTPDLSLTDSRHSGYERLRHDIVQSTVRLVNAPETIPFIRHGQLFEYWRESKLASWDSWSDEERRRHRFIHQFYVKFAKQFHIRFGDVLEREVSAHLNRMTGSTLVLGCGSGKEVEYIASRMNGPVLGMDFSPVAIEIAKEEHPTLAENFVVADFYDLDLLFDDEFDAIVANASFVHLFQRSDIDGILQKVWRRLSRNGHAFLRGLYREETRTNLPVKEEMHKSRDRWDADRWFVYYSRAELADRCRAIGFDVLDDVTEEIARSEYDYRGKQLNEIREKGFRHVKFQGVYWPTLFLRKSRNTAK